MEKNNKGLIIVVILLVLAVLGLVCYICYDKGVFGKKDSADNNAENADKIDNSAKIEEISLDDSRFINIYNKVKSYSYRKNRSDGYQSFSDSDLFSLVSGELKEDDFVKTSEVYNFNDKYPCDVYNLKNSIVLDHLKKYFGSEVALDMYKLINPQHAYATNVTINSCSGIDIVSSDNDGNYKVTFTGIGGSVTGPMPKITETKIVSATIENNEIIVKEKAIYYDTNAATATEYGHITYNIYSDVKKQNKIDSKEYLNENEIVNGIITVEDYLDKASTITYKFAYDKDTNSYYFKSSVIE